MSEAKPLSRRRSRRTRRSNSASSPHLAVDVVNRQRLITVPIRRIQSALRHVLRAESVPRCQLELVIVDDLAIRALHREFMQIDTPTDVLTFPLSEEGEPVGGVVVASAETAVREANRRGLTPLSELLLYLIHGLLHLCGYDDLIGPDARRMRRRQAQLWQEVQIQWQGKTRSGKTVDH